MLYTEINFCFKSNTYFFSKTCGFLSYTNSHWREHPLYYSDCLPEEPAVTVWLLNEQLGTSVRNFQGLSWLIIRIPW